MFPRFRSPVLPFARRVSTWACLPWRLSSQATLRPLKHRSSVPCCHRNNAVARRSSALRLHHDALDHGGCHEEPNNQLRSIMGPQAQYTTRATHCCTALALRNVNF